jgi:hypothetical protein
MEEVGFHLNGKKWPLIIEDFTMYNLAQKEKISSMFTLLDFFRIVVSYKLSLIRDV